MFEFLPASLVVPGISVEWAFLGEMSGPFAVEAALALPILPTEWFAEVHAHAFAEEFELVELFDGP